MFKISFLTLMSKPTQKKVAKQHLSFVVVRILSASAETKNRRLCSRSRIFASRTMLM